MSPVLSVRDLRVSFPAATVVDGVSFDVMPGEIVGVVGESGSGKSMTARSVLRLLPRTARLTGSVRFRGDEVLAMSPAAIRAMRGALVFVAIGAINWLDMARIVRGQALSLRQREFVDAARLAGLTPLAIVRAHIVPNLLGVVIVCATLTVPQVILVESFLSFLGLGVQEPATSWGVLVNDGAADMEAAPWALLFPAGFLATTLLCLNFIGDGLRDALDPKRGR